MSKIFFILSISLNIFSAFNILSSDDHKQQNLNHESNLNISGKLFIISAPSGAGKSTLIQAILQEIQYPIKQVITYTTRAPRPGEIPGKDYHFIDKDLFESRIKEGFFLEYSHAYNKYYGSPIDILNDIKNGDSFIVIVDYVGAKAIKAIYSEAVGIWITPPNLEVLRGRLNARGCHSVQDLNHRLELAAKEMDLERDGIFSHTVINDDFEIAKDEIKAIFCDNIDKK